MVVQTVDSGYKQTELGIIPTDWCYGKFEDVMTGFSSGQTPSRAKPEYYKGNIPWITSSELDYNIIKDTSEKITPEAVRNTNLKMIPKGTFLFAITGLEAEGTRGSCAITGIPATTNQSCMALYPKKGVLTTEYLFHFYVGYGKRLALKYCQGTKQQSYIGGTARFLPIVFPPTIEEQSAIVQVLSDIDSLIRFLDKLVKKKKNIKQGTMQELLTGKKRLPGFNREWTVKNLGEIADIKTGKKNNKDKAKDGEYPFFVRSQTVERINSYSFDGEAILVPGEGGIGNIFHYIKGRFDYHQRVYKISGFDEDVSGKFIYFYMIQNFNKQAAKSSVKATVDSLRLPAFQNFESNIPKSKVEQSAIAQILSDMDAEIEELEHEKEKYKQLKIGMMQQLLTGRIRLKWKS